MDLATIENAEERLRLAMLTSDVAELAELLAPELVFTTFLGEAITKQQDLDAHSSGLLAMHSIVVSERRVIPYGETIVVTCLAEIDATFDGDRTQHPFRFLRVWAPAPGGGVHVVAGQATLVFASLGL
ncbi:MAG: hypothetical protein RJA70_108 [Pseudomonadota bacterium]|jgi:ketosteroid isomerase-like protein